MDQGKISLTRRQLERDINVCPFALQMTSYTVFSSFSFLEDLVDRQRRTRPQFEGGFLLLEFGLASERENERRRWRNDDRRKEIKGKFDNRLVRK